jgi:membrane associated rhomboid family serine protease
MSPTYTDLLEIILRNCEASHPRPWYPAEFSQSTGVPREPLDACLDQLRMRGLVQLTPWLQGFGQGYQLTQHGAEVLQQPRLLARLRQGDVPASTAVAAARIGPVSSARWAGEEHALASTRGERVRAALMDESRPIATQIILMLNIVYFLVGLVVDVAKFGGQPGYYLTGGLMGRDAAQNALLNETYSTLGWLHGTYLLSGEWWRLISYGFLHGGLLHLGANMYGLYVLGPALERWWGRPQYVAIYFISCVGSGATAVLLTPGSPLVGASGAICGLLGSMATWLFLNKSHLPARVVEGLRSNILTNIVLIAMLSFFMRDVVSWAGHLGGGVVGALVAFPLNMAHFDTGVRRWLGWAATAGAVLLGLGLFQFTLGRGGRAEALVMEQASKLIAENVKNTGINKNWPGDAEAKEQAAQYRKTKEELEAALAKLQQLGPQSRPEQDNYFKTGIALLELAIPYCERVANALQSKQTWTDKERAALRADFSSIQDAYSRHEEAWKRLKQTGQDDGKDAADQGKGDEARGGKGQGDNAAFVKNKNMLFRADEQARDVLNKLAIPLLPPKKLQWPGDAEAAKLVEKFRAAKQELTKVVDQVKQAGADPHPEVNAFYSAGTAFLQKTAHFCDKMADALQSKQTWTEEQRKALDEEFEEIRRLLDRFGDAWRKLQQAKEDKGK